MIGTTISHYKILEKLGEGGMGVVYKAEDTRLKRLVAIKFLPKRLSIHGEERDRFTQEAQAASSLNHPNICVIHEIDEMNDETFMVMEFVDGVTLREWIVNKARQSQGYRKQAVKECVDIAEQIAEGLGKAHEKGIIHRDIKSENIMITAEGRVKIMDFGLAKLRGVSKLTKIGSTIGTVAYMSPEQVEGTETDHRTDIFSFGVVMYELLTGQLPFRAEHETAMMYEIINVEPKNVADLKQGIDDELSRIVMKCLEKERDVRYQSMKDVTVDIKRQKRSSVGKTVERPAMKRPSDVGSKTEKKSGRSTMLFVAAGVVLLVAAAIVYKGFFPAPSQGSSPQLETKIAKITSRPGLEDEACWSPDGKFIAYTSDEKGNFDICLLPITGANSQPIRVTDDPADDMEPAWSPDGSQLAFVSARNHGGRMTLMLSSGEIEPYVKGKNGDIFLMPAFGGTAVKLVESGFDPAWSPDGRQIVFRSIRGGQWDLWTVPVTGGEPVQLTNDPAADFHPVFSPDGKWILYAAGTNGSAFDLFLIQSSGGTPRQLTNDHHLVLRPAWSADGKTIFWSSARGGSLNLWKADYSAEKQSIGKPERVTIGEGDNVNISASRAGRMLAYSTVKNTGDIWEMDLETKTLRQVSSETSSEDHPQLSPDGKTLALSSDRTGTAQIWTMDINGNFLSQITTAKFGALNPHWSPDGTQISYNPSDETGFSSLVLRSVSDVSIKTVLSGKMASDHEWSRDGKYIAADVVSAPLIGIVICDLNTGTTRKLLDIKEQNLLATWSPDGKTIAFNIEKQNGRQVWTVPVEGGTPHQLTHGESEYSHPEWSPKNADAIVCLRDHRNVCLITPSTGVITDLTNFVESNISLDYPSWSFDGKKIYFSLWKKVGDLYTLENY